jgi:hypothetical protein
MHLVDSIEPNASFLAPQLLIPVLPWVNALTA